MLEIVGVIDGDGDAGINVSTVNGQIKEASKFSTSNNKFSPDSLVNEFPADKL